MCTCRVLFPCLAGDRTGNFVTTMYIGLLDRLVDAGGLAYWKGVFDGASSPAASAAFATRHGPSACRCWHRRNTRRRIRPTTRMSCDSIARISDAIQATSEIAYWRGQLDSHALTTTDLIDQFAASAEFTGRLNTFFRPGLLVAGFAARAMVIRRSATSGRSACTFRRRKKNPSCREKRSSADGRGRSAARCA